MTSEGEFMFHWEDAKSRGGKFNKNELNQKKKSGSPGVANQKSSMENQYVGVLDWLLAI